MTQNKDAEVGQQIKQLRSSCPRGPMSQTDLAAQMTDRGFPMTQQTVLKIEKGARSLKLVEAVAVAEILGAQVRHLYVEDDVTRQAHRAHALQTDVSHHALIAAQNLLQVERRLAVFKQYVESGDDPKAVHARLRESAREMLDMSTEELVASTVVALRQEKSSSDHG